MCKLLKRTAAVLLAMTMMSAALTGCGGGSADSGTAGDASGTTETGETGGSGETANDGEIVKLRVWGFGYTSSSDDCAAVAEAVNEITREKIGVEIELVRNGDGEKLNLALTSGEQLDLVNYHTYSGGLSTLVTNGYALPLDDLVAEYGQDMVQTVGEDNLVLGKINGVLYSVPSLSQVTATSYGLAMRADILAEMGIDPATIKTWDDVHDVLLQVKEAYPDLYPVVPSWGGGGQQKTFAFDNLGTGFWDGLGILENAHDSSTTVVNMYETDSYREFVERMYQWNQEGLLMPDSTTSNETDLMKSVGFSDFENNSPTKASELTTSWGHEAVVIQLVEPFKASGIGGSSWFIPSVCEHPEKAMQLWNLMYTDPEIDNLLVNGVEGVHYERVDDEHVKAIDGTTWEPTLYWGWPNGELATLSEGADPNQWNELNEFSAGASNSPALGFRFDNSTVMNEITACNNVIAKYDVGLRWGELNPDEALPKFNEELKAAGLDTIIAEKQKQLDEFLAQ
ncbi:MAG: ABC transporter substrate-binding protein [Eubacterium sp.]|nr:ABC transporter substrate-binding protein [Eubacterium sp.]